MGFSSGLPLLRSPSAPSAGGCARWGSSSRRSVSSRWSGCPVQLQVPVGARDGPRAVSAPHARARSAARLGPRHTARARGRRSSAMGLSEPASHAARDGGLDARGGVLLREPGHRDRRLPDRDPRARTSRVAGASATQLGYRIGTLASGAGAFALAAFLSWPTVYPRDGRAHVGWVAHGAARARAARPRAPRPRPGRASFLGNLRTAVVEPLARLHRAGAAGSRSCWSHSSTSSATRSAGQMANPFYLRPPVQQARGRQRDEGVRRRRDDGWASSSGAPLVTGDRPPSGRC